jgi:hypothetical protein
LTDVGSWQGHIPFAFAAIQYFQPRVFVELGTHKGDSYCAFCQAVQTSGLPVACFAVDTWEGDSQSGFYGVDVFEELSAYNNSRYGLFSNLLRMTFDEALGHFNNGTVDLLHIDGLHSYEAVKHDFESWLPKMSSHGIVLLHDTHVRENGFGVWRLWQELAARYPSFEYLHANGLGVLGVGAASATESMGFFRMPDEAADWVRRLFNRLGDAVGLCAQMAAANTKIRQQGTFIDFQEKRMEEIAATSESRREYIGSLEKRMEEVALDNKQKMEEVALHNKQKEEYIAGLVARMEEIAATGESRREYIGVLEKRIEEVSVNNERRGEYIGVLERSLEEMTRKKRSIFRRLKKS